MVTYWVDPGDSGDPVDVTVRFSGHRTGVTGRPAPGDTFARSETMTAIVPGSGPVAASAEIRGINPGGWAVTARLTTGGPALYGYEQQGALAAPRRDPPGRHGQGAHHTSSLLRTKIPGVFRPAYASLITLGVLAGLAVEALLLRHGHYGLTAALGYSLAAVAAGVIGGKAWYVAIHKGRKFDGWCIQGFTGGAAVIVAVVVAIRAGLPAGAFLAAAGPALLIGLAIGRPGCFSAGCCAGRATRSRWGGQVIGPSRRLPRARATA
jgi:phosphatidylglycerol---prolipoprotein diacylglyceryl transferase